MPFHFREPPELFSELMTPVAQYAHRGFMLTFHSFGIRRSIFRVIAHRLRRIFPKSTRHPGRYRRRGAAFIGHSPAIFASSCKHHIPLSSEHKIIGKTETRLHEQGLIQVALKRAHVPKTSPLLLMPSEAACGIRTLLAQKSEKGETTSGGRRTILP